MKMERRTSPPRRLGFQMGTAVAAASMMLGLTHAASAAPEPAGDGDEGPETAVTECMPAEGVVWEETAGARFTDNNVTVYAGDDSLIQNRGVEGLTVVDGNLTVAFPPEEDSGSESSESPEDSETDADPFRFGSVQGGSGSVPKAEALMLAVTGDLEVDGDLQEVFVERVTADNSETDTDPRSEPGSYMVGAWDGPADMVGAGDFTEPFDLQGTHADNFGSTLAAVSRVLSRLDNTGEVEAAADEEKTGGDRGRQSGPGASTPLVFEGDGESELQVFTVTGRLLADRGELRFEGIPEGAAVLLNYRGSRAELPGSYAITLDGDVLETGSEQWAEFAQRLLWHFPSARTLALEAGSGEAGNSSEWLGSVVAGHSRSQVSITDTSINGRLYSRGSLNIAGETVVRSYPFVGVPEFDCKPHVSPETGGFALLGELKGIEPADLPDGADFRVEATIVEPDAEPYTEELLVSADATQTKGSEDLPVGTKLTFDQKRRPAVEGYTWSSVSFDPATVTIQDGKVTQVTVTNTYTEDPVELGGFNIRGAVQGVHQDRLEGNASLQVTATWETKESEEVDPVRHLEEFTVPVSGEAVPGPQDIPEGTEVFLTLTSVPTVEGFIWSDASFAPRSVTVSAEETPEVVATASYVRQVPKYGGFSLQNLLDGAEPSDFSPGTSFVVRASWVQDDVGRFEEFALPVTGALVAGPTDIPVGTEVRFSVIQSPRAKGFAWKSVTFSPSTVTVTDGGNPTVQALNRYRAVDTPVGGFSLSAGLAGVSAADFPPGATIPVTATWTVNGNKVSVAYELTLDGVPVQGPQDIPVGTDVTFTAPSSPNLPEHRASGISFSTSTLTISEGEDRQVTVMSSYRPDVATEGSWTIALLVALAGVALSAGALQLYRRNRRTNETAEDQILG